MTRTRDRASGIPSGTPASFASDTLQPKIMPNELDLNADLGEGAGQDAELIPWLTSVNICCGAHAGSPEIIRETLRLARDHRVVVGAHPGYPDQAHFGRRERNDPPAVLEAELRRQLDELNLLAAAEGVQVRYLKAHGALYNQAMRYRTVAETLVRIAQEYRLPVLGLPGSELEAAASGVIPFIPEGFADRRYLPDGRLVPRSAANAMLDDPEEVVAHVRALMVRWQVRTVCFHGDHPGAVARLRAVRLMLEHQGISLRPFLPSA
jgi:UPF0271 protein